MNFERPTEDRMCPASKTHSWVHLRLSTGASCHLVQDGKTTLGKPIRTAGRSSELTVQD